VSRQDCDAKQAAKAKLGKREGIAAPLLGGGDGVPRPSGQQGIPCGPFLIKQGQDLRQILEVKGGGQEQKRESRGGDCVARVVRCRYPSF